MQPTAPNTASISAMLLAAGRGERMRPLTDTTPKPLLRVQGKPLLQWHLEALLAGGFTRSVVNTAWLGEQLAQQLGGVFRLQRPQNERGQLSKTEQRGTAMALQYSHEGQDFGAALETAGGIARALPLLGDVFWVLAGDVFAPDFRFMQADVDRFVDSGKLAHLWLVPNPPHNPHGDFGLGAPDSTGTTPALPVAADAGLPRYTYSTIGLYRRELFSPPWCNIPAGNPLGAKAALAPLLRAAMAQYTISASLYTGRWTDVGTPERLAALNAAWPLPPNTHRSC